MEDEILNIHSSLGIDGQWTIGLAVFLLEFPVNSLHIPGAFNEQAWRTHSLDVELTSVSHIQLQREYGLLCRKPLPFQIPDGLPLQLTDGIIEAHDVDGREYQDSERLEQVLTQFKPEIPADIMINAVINDAVAYSREIDQREDDMTVVVVKVA